MFVILFALSMMVHSHGGRTVSQGGIEEILCAIHVSFNCRVESKYNLTRRDRPIVLPLMPHSVCDWGVLVCK